MQPDASGRPCPACKATKYEPFLEERIDRTRLDAMAFASRKTPEFMNLRMVRCTKCGLVYAPTIPTATALAAEYEKAGYDSGDEARWAASTYADELRDVLGRPNGAALEVGAGNGAFLAHLVRAGFSPVIGIEPSTAAIAAAAPEIQPLLTEGAFEDIAVGQQFGFISCFMTLEHLAEPETFLAKAATLLQPGGVLALVVHDWSAPLNRLLGRRSPIIDIEHMQIFHAKSLEILLRRMGFERIAIRRIRNRYPLRYWLRLSPIPASLKTVMLACLRRIGLDGLPISIGVGNLVAVASKPER